MLLFLQNNFCIYKKYTIAIIIIIFYIYIIIHKYKIEILKYNYNYLNLEKKINKIKIGIVSRSLKNGGIERQTSLILYYFNKIKMFELFLFTKKNKQKNEYVIDKKIQRFVIKKKNFIKMLINKKIDILIYQFYDVRQIKELKKLKKLKTILINRSCFLHWIYYKKYYFYQTYYTIYKSFKYIISLIPFENDYLFKKWGINSILMNNFIAYEYNSITPSNLSSKNILMIGRGTDKIKRFELGIEAMKYIKMEIDDSKMIIISKINFYHRFLVNKLNLTNNIKFVGYSSKPEIFYKDACLHIFPTLAEAFPNILSETLVYGIPNILLGLDYVSTSKGGTIIIYDDSPLSIAKIAIKIIKNKRYRKKLGKDARKNMNNFRNELLLKKWIKLIISVYKGDDFYANLKKNKKINENDALKILRNQIKLLKKRNKKFCNITLNDILNFTFMQNIKFNIN